MNWPAHELLRLCLGRQSHYHRDLGASLDTAFTRLVPSTRYSLASVLFVRQYLEIPDSVDLGGPARDDPYGAVFLFDYRRTGDDSAGA